MSNRFSSDFGYLSGGGAGDYLYEGMAGGFGRSGGLTVREELRLIRRALNQINGDIDNIKRVNKELGDKLDLIQRGADITSGVAGTAFSMYYLGRLAARSTGGLAAGIGLSVLTGAGVGFEAAVRAQSEYQALDEAIARKQIWATEAGYQRRRDEIWVRGLIHAATLGIL